jgi:hypothetical protein
MDKNIRYYVARRPCCGCIAAMVVDDATIPDDEKGEMVRGCIESGLKVDRLTIDQVTGIFLAQRDCMHDADDHFTPIDDDSDNDIPF